MGLAKVANLEGGSVVLQSENDGSLCPLCPRGSRAEQRGKSGCYDFHAFVGVEITKIKNTKWPNLTEKQAKDETRGTCWHPGS